MAILGVKYWFSKTLEVFFKIFFELFRMDFIVDDQLNVFLIEVLEEHKAISFDILYYVILYNILFIEENIL